MEVHRRNLDVWVKGFLVEQNRTPSIMDHKEAIRQVVEIKVFKRFLQSDDVPFPRNVLFDGFFFSTSGSWVPVVDTAPYRIVVSKDGDKCSASEDT